MDEHTIAWIIYMLGGMALGLVGWRITRRWSRYARHLILVSYAVLVATPFSLQLEPPASAYAPALFIVVLNTLFQGWDSALDAAVTLLLIWAVALVLSLALLLLTRRRSPRMEIEPEAENPSI